MKPEDVREWNLRQNAQAGWYGHKDPRSPEWAYQAVDILKMKWRAIDLDYKHFLDMIVEIIRNESWLVIPTSAPYGDLNTLFKAEIGVSAEEAMARVRIAEENAGVDPSDSIVPVLAMLFPNLYGSGAKRERAEGGILGAEHGHKGAQFGKRGGRGKKTPLGVSDTKGGFSEARNPKTHKETKPRRDRRNPDHLLRRLAQIDSETGSEWVARYQSGEFESPRAAAKAAGIAISPSVTLGNPDTVAQAIVRLMGKEYAMLLAKTLSGDDPE